MPGELLALVDGLRRYVDHLVDGLLEKVDGLSAGLGAVGRRLCQVRGEMQRETARNRRRLRDLEARVADLERRHALTMRAGCRRRH